MPEPTLSLHSHTVYSQRDAICTVDKVLDKVKANGGTHYAVTDHGTVQGWIAVRDGCKKRKLTPLYGCELYVNQFILEIQEILKLRDATPKKEQASVILREIRNKIAPKMSPAQLLYFMSNLDDPLSFEATAKQLLNRLAFGYEHLVAVAINDEGRTNLIKIQNSGWSSGYYYKPQVTWEIIQRLSGGITFTTACLGGPLAKRMAYDGSGGEGMAFLRRFEAIKDRFYLEVQPLDSLHQRRYNAHVINLAERTGFPLILSQDNHHVDEKDWISHRMLMLSQNDKTIDFIENVYRYQGKEYQQSDLKKHLGLITNWEFETFIETNKVEVVRAAGHHYGEVRLHWRTNDEVRKQVETTNQELLPVIERCFAETTKICEATKDIAWPTKHHIPHHSTARADALAICCQRLADMNLGPEKMAAYGAWLRKEDKVITACNFWDYIWTLYQVTGTVQKEGIPIGYARGSGGGCLVMYLMDIIRVDPVKYGLYFERFLNPARLGLDPITLEKVKEMVSCPDADLDFSSLNRDRVVKICRELFGTERVAPIGTIGEAKVKTAFADVCRVLDITQKDFMPASKELPDDVNGVMTFEQAMERPAFKKFVDEHSQIAGILPNIMGVVRSTGTHASGVCISDVRLDENIPLARAGSKEGGDLVTAFGESGAVRELESIGYIKFDILATITVDHVSLCARNVHKEHLRNGGKPWTKGDEKMLYPEQIPHYTEDDPAVMKAVFYPGNTDGIFQFEESIGKQISSQVKPDTVGELSDISTMIRPGCLQAKCTYYTPVPNAAPLATDTNGLHFLYSARKFNRDINPPPNLPQAVLDVLQPTHYCCIYQEQMMFLIQVITGGKMSLGEGDIYRRAIEHGAKGKKDAQETVLKMEAEMKSKAIYPPEIVDQVCAIIKGGAAYSFNKAHALAYSLFTYAQGWFKHYYPHIFVASHVTLLAADNKLDKMHKIMNNARFMGIEIKAPHVRYSTNEATWSEDKKTVYLPYTVIKGLKGETAEALPRAAAGCTDLLQFLLNTRKESSIKKNHLVNLARIGAFDGMGFKYRQQTTAAVVYIMERLTAKSTEQHIRQFYAEAQKFESNGDCANWAKQVAEIEVFGSFINESPLNKVAEWAEDNGYAPLSEIVPQKDKVFDVYFMITAVTKKVHKSGKSAGKEWLKLTCWDGKNVCDLSVWSFELDDSISESDRLNRKVIGYRPIIAPNRCYLAQVQAPGDRPVSLAQRIRRNEKGEWTESPTLVMKNNIGDT